MGTPLSKVMSLLASELQHFLSAGEDDLPACAVRIAAVAQRRNNEEAAAATLKAGTDMSCEGGPCSLSVMLCTAATAW